MLFIMLTDTLISFDDNQSLYLQIYTLDDWNNIPDYHLIAPFISNFNSLLSHPLTSGARPHGTRLFSNVSLCVRGSET